jgi:hypothetical protein
MGDQRRLSRNSSQFFSFLQPLNFPISTASSGGFVRPSHEPYDDEHSDHCTKTGGGARLARQEDAGRRRAARRRAFAHGAAGLAGTAVHAPVCSPSFALGARSCFPMHACSTRLEKSLVWKMTRSCLYSGDTLS